MPNSTLKLPVIPQPSPVACSVYRDQRPDGWTTTIARAWASGDATHCTLCPRSLCKIDPTGTLCLVAISSYVSDEDAVYRRRSLGAEVLLIPHGSNRNRVTG